MARPDASVLARFGFRSPERVLAEIGDAWANDDRWTDLLQVLGSGADPDGGVMRLSRLERDTMEALLAAPSANAGLLRAIAFSDYLASLASRDEGSDVRAMRDTRFLEIAASDLSSPPDRASFVATTQALTDLADACVQRILDEDGSDVRLAVMAMGKYGARELNYASDIDVLFVTPDEDIEEATRLARRVIETMNGPPAVFRVDVDLRPEGRDGQLVRSLDAYRTYYERWAKVWEFQALIKCRWAAGDEQLGNDFLAMVEPMVWPEVLKQEAIEQIRELKARAEREVARRKRPSDEVKLGRGGIRDAEFAVQLLQLVHGRHHPQLRVRATLDALDVLGADGFVGPDDVAELEDAYVFLRHVEHRLQLEGGRQTHTLPRDPGKRELVARSLQFEDRQRFEEKWTQTTAIVRSLHERLFYRPLLEAFAEVPTVRTTMTPEEADERLAALGFDRPPRVREAIAAMTSGGTRRAKVMRAILPGVLAWMAETPEPDAGVIRLAAVAHQLDTGPHLLGVLRDEPPAVEVLCQVLGTGQVLASMLERDPSLVASLQDGARQDMKAQAKAVTSRASSAADAVAALRRMKDGEFLRLAARDIGAGDDPDVFASVAVELSDLGDACLDAALDLARNEQAARTGGPPPGGFAILALGRYGGRELSYASDLDVIFVYERDDPCPDGTDARLFHSAVAESVIRSLSDTPPIFKVDAELRPEGRSGPIVRSLESTLVYYSRWAQLWEFQALTRARPAAGDMILGRRLLDAVASRVWRASLTSDDVAEIRKMKARIERERVRARDDPRYEVKLGVGGLADVEFTVQLAQMQNGHAHPELRTPNTLRAIDRLEEVGIIDVRDAGWLRDAYLLLNRVRNHMFLLRGLATDALPQRDEELERLARSLGYGRGSRARFLEHYRRVTRRARRVTDRLFYGEE